MRNSLFEAIKTALQPHLDMVLSDLLPGGRVKGNEYICGSVGGGSGDSCKTNLSTGVGCDFATGEKWGDIVALVALVKRCSQKEAAQFLAEQYGIDIANSSGGTAKSKPTRKRQSVKADKAVFTPTMPIPDSAPDFPEQYRNIPRWCYRDANGMELCYAFRLDKPDGSKDFVPLCFCRDGGGNHQWREMAPPVPRSLYGLDRLAKAVLDAPILLVEGEKTADAATALFPDHVCMTWMGGANATGKTDFSPLAGRNVIIWPDNDAPGIKAAAELVGGVVPKDESRQGREHFTKRPESEWNVKEGTHKALVDADTFREVQESRKRRRDAKNINRKGRNQKREYLLSAGFGTCSRCGGGINGTTKRVNGRQYPGTTAPQPKMSALRLAPVMVLPWIHWMSSS